MSLSSSSIFLSLAAPPASAKLGACLTAASRGNDALPVRDKIGDDLAAVSVLYGGSDGDLYDEILSVLAVLLLSAPVFAVLRFVFSLVSEVHQGPEVTVGREYDAASASPVPSVRSSLGDVGLSPEGYRSVSSLA